MGLQDEPVPFQKAPAASIAVANIYKINRPFCFVPPNSGGDLLPIGVDKHQSARAKKRLHPMIVLSHIAIIAAGGICQRGSLEVAPTLDHACQVSCAPRIEGRIEANR